ncbi:MAG TPA: histidine phosphatase family protein [Thermoanaerobaculia bacterium]|nr:histidine phosphatase family protein [Thermoanaerobaculia bacterium]
MTEQLILVRHGETVHNVAGIAQGWGDSDLSERGQRQVARLAERLKAFSPDAIYSSTLQRAVATAERIAAVVGLDVRLVDDLREMNYGRWEGQNFRDIRRNEEPVYRRWIAEPDFPCPEGESHVDVLARVRRALELINGSKSPVIVTHGTAIRIATTALLELPLTASRHFAQDNASINVFLRRGDRWVLKLWNDNTHCEQS